ncbi:hypothetical protein PoB_005547500 [Plakobranchus ocellatus]|uniref:Uncharacterized protein n=1 Tax=Plakobranchus ocellatus TaxID=259542 RepID=A0AAV4CBD9_9GAST|nr:hypothetical protein PoB_005547500 [Plakobranchus ocellatus]
MDSVSSHAPEMKAIGCERAGELKTSMENQWSCFKYERYSHITCNCTYPRPSVKKAGADSGASAVPVLEVTDNLKSEMKAGMLRLASKKTVPLVAIEPHSGIQKGRRIFVCLH